MGQGFSLSDENLNELYKDTATKGGVGEIVQDDWRIMVINLGPKPKQARNHVLYSMTAEKKGWVVGGHKITLSVRTSHNEGDVKAKLRNEINLRINQITAQGKAESKKGGLPLNLKL